jgi:TRAP-type C4-dicarboxylate transport system permease small subunit
MARTEKILNILVRIMLYLAMVLLAAMMLLTVADVSGRYLFNLPIEGSTEVTQQLLVSLAYFGLVWCTMKKAHIKLDLFTERIPLVAWAIIDILFYLLSVVLFSCIAWQNFIMARDSMLAGHSSWVLNIPNYPFYLLVAIACGVVVLILLLFMIQNIDQVMKRWK